MNNEEPRKQIKAVPGAFPHVEWIDLKQDGVLVECAVMKRDPANNVYFFPLASLDNVDRQRVANILSNRNAATFDLWDLMSQITLNNGINALTYFHQLVKVLTPSGKIMTPSVGHRGF